MLTLLSLAAAAASPHLRPFAGCQGGTLAGCPSVLNTTQAWFEQRIDHFDWSAPLGGAARTYKQRYFVNRQWWKPGGPIFFYFGNEDNVELYVNHTGLMWEAARPAGAALVFAEHRYYGESVPFAPGTPGCMAFLTTEQAMADFAYLLYAIRDEWKAWGSAVVGFGGSYGGMLGAWFRLKYPNAIDGVLAASAPIWSFVGLAPPYDPDTFYRIVSRDASAAGGATDHCRANVKRALQRIVAAGATEEGRGALKAGFRLCAAPRDAREAEAVKAWVEGPWATLAMGNYPYASSYLVHGDFLLPAWPVRAACAPLDAPLPTDAELFDAARRGLSLAYYNASGAAGPCNNVTAAAASASASARRKMTSPLAAPPRHAPSAVGDGPAACTGSWGYQWCTEMVQPFTSGTEADMFWPYAPYNYSWSAADCRRTWGVTPTESWARVGLGGKRIADASNIIFSNGAYDPWSGGGVLSAPTAALPAVHIPSGAHHIDLMFSDAADPPDVAAARAEEMRIIYGWMQPGSGRSANARAAPSVARQRAARKTPPLWGGAARWSAFANNFTSPEVAEHTWLFNYYYDASRSASVWQHLDGQRDWVCSLGSAALTARGAPCNAIHATDGWLYIQFPASPRLRTETSCCKCTDDPAMGFVRPDWLRHPEVQWRGVERINGVEADHWFLDANFTAYDNHYWSTATPEQRPVRFMEHVSDAGNRTKVWDFNLAAFSPGDQFPALFAPPPACETMCARSPAGYPGCTGAVGDPSP